MKRSIILTILTILTAVPAMAQKDLSELNGMTDGQVKKTYGQPKEYTANHEYTMSSYFRYDDMEIFYTQSHESIDCFDISSDRVKVLSLSLKGKEQPFTSVSKTESSKQYPSFPKMTCLMKDTTSTIISLQNNRS